MIQDIPNYGPNDPVVMDAFRRQMEGMEENEWREWCKLDSEKMRSIVEEMGQKAIEEVLKAEGRMEEKGERS